MDNTRRKKEHIWAIQKEIFMQEKKYKKKENVGFFVEECLECIEPAIFLAVARQPKKNGRCLTPRGKIWLGAFFLAGSFVFFWKSSGGRHQKQEIFINVDCFEWTSTRSVYLCIDIDFLELIKWKTLLTSLNSQLLVSLKKRFYRSVVDCPPQFCSFSCFAVWPRFYHCNWAVDNSTDVTEISCPFHSKNHLHQL